MPPRSPRAPRAPRVPGDSAATATAEYSTAEFAQAVPVSTGLPDQSDIDPATIDRPQLSAQGWVVPENLGAPPKSAKGL